MANSEKFYPDHKLWRDGTEQELIPDFGEGLQDAVDFMKSALRSYRHMDLTFFRKEIRIQNSKFYITLRSVQSKKNHLFKKAVDKVLN